MEEVEVCYTLGKGGLRVPKSHTLVEFYGSIDEAVATLGLARAFLKDKELKEDLKRIQEILYKVAASVYLGSLLVTNEDINFMKEVLKKRGGERPKAFLAPSGPPEVAAIHVGRAIVRRAERVLCSLILGTQQDWMITLGETLNIMSQALFNIAIEACKREKNCELETLS
ncbi:MAG: ATP:cob(I)alamin adenosyltransferase [Acidilobaceae archaeon]